MQSIHGSRNRVFFLLICMVVLAAGCGNDSSDPVLPGVEPEVVNNPDTFQFQVTSVKNYTGSWTYDWTTTGTLVNVDQSCAVTSGEVMLTIKDSAGTTVYSGDLREGGSYTTAEGATGLWRIMVTLTNGSGTLNFRTEKNM